MTQVLPASAQGDMPDPLPVLVASHPRSGTHLVIDTIRRQVPGMRNWRPWGLPLDHLYLNLERTCSDNRHFDDALARRILARPRRGILKTHFLADLSESWIAEESGPLAPRWRALAEAARAIYINRHPLKVMASYHQFLAGIDPHIATLGFRAFLESPHWTGTTDRLGWWQQHATGWLNRPNTHVLHYEGLMRDPAKALAGVGAFLGETIKNRQPYLPPMVTTVNRTRMDRLLRLSPDSTAIVADSKRFPAPDWRSALGSTELDWIEGRCGALLHRLGYDLRAL